MFKQLINCEVCLLKKNGEKYNNIKAVLDKKTITIPFSNDEKYYIETGDILERKLPNGFIEKYEVINPTFNEKFHAIPQHYQIDVQKIGVPVKPNTVVSHININGDHNRINQESIDQSQNTINLNSDIPKYLSDIRDEIEGLKVSESEKKKYLEIIEQVRQHCSAANKSKKIILALLNALPDTAKIISSARLLLSTYFP